MLLNVYGAVLVFDYRYTIRATSEKEQGVKVQFYSHVILASLWTNSPYDRGQNKLKEITECMPHFRDRLCNSTGLLCY